MLKVKQQKIYQIDLIIKKINKIKEYDDDTALKELQKEVGGYNLANVDGSDARRYLKALAEGNQDYVVKRLKKHAQTRTLDYSKMKQEIYATFTIRNRQRA